MKTFRLLLLTLPLLLAACQPATPAPTITATPFTPPPPTATEPVLPTATPPGAEHITGSIELANGLCCAGGETGTHIEIPAKISGLSRAALVTDMRLAYSYVSGEPDIDGAEWQPLVEETSFPIELVTNWVGFYACVQFRDEAGNISEVYCDEISVEGMPAIPSPLLELDYDLLWLTGWSGDLMRFDHATQEVSCLVGQQSDCQIFIAGEVGTFRLNSDRTKLVFQFRDTTKEDQIQKLAILDLQTLDFHIFHELEENVDLQDLALSPDGMWVAYQQQHDVDYEDGHREEVIKKRIVSTLGADSPAYELECDTCKYISLQWSEDSKYLSFGGGNDLWVVRLTEGSWLASSHFVNSTSTINYPYGWSSEFNYLLTAEWSSNDPGDIIVYNYLFEQLHRSLQKASWPSHH